MTHWIIAEPKYVLLCTDIRILVQRSRKVSPLASSLSKPNTPLCMKWSYWSKFKFRSPHWPNLSFGKSNLIGWLIQVSRPQLTLNVTFGGRSQARLMKELCPLKWQKSRISLKKSSCKTPTNLTVDGCSVQAQTSECLKGPHTSCCVP